MIAPLIGMPQGAEWLVILAIVVLVFGAAKLPDLARGSGQALRIFKAETKGLRDDEEKDQATLPPVATTPTEVVSPVQPAPTSAAPLVTPPPAASPTPQATPPAQLDPIDKPQA